MSDASSLSTFSDVMAIAARLVPAALLAALLAALPAALSAALWAAFSINLPNCACAGAADRATAIIASAARRAERSR